MIPAACVPVFSASLLTICAPEYVQESGVECALYVVTAVHGSVWSFVCVVRVCRTHQTQKYVVWVHISAVY